ncbi:MAG TPA: hypothetical protein P5239_10940, partial [Victivallales bacterium]|nr:hypothetical protein [Victivallales bacterium]
LEDSSQVKTGSWHMSKMKASPIESEEAKIGKKVLRFSGIADSGVGKADCPIYEGKINANSKISLWIKIFPDSNVSKIGLQTTDNENEGLFVLFNVDWTGWKKIEVDFNNAEQAWQQQDKNGKTDFPINGIRLVWFTKEQGYSYVDVDSLELITDSKFASGKIDKNFIVPDWTEAEKPSSAIFIFNNGKNEEQSIELSLIIQEDSALFNKKAPDPLLGSDHAIGAKGWLIYDDKKIVDNTLTDDDDFSSASTEWINDHFTEASQIIDLGKVIKIKAIKFKSGDANWTWLLDMLKSNDGENFTPIPELQNINLHKRWGEFPIQINTPFEARYLKLQYKTENNEKKPVIRMPSAIMVYDGIEDEKFEIPKVGKVVFSDKKNIKIPSFNFSIEEIKLPPLPLGGYLISTMINLENKTEIYNSNFFSFKPAEKKLGEKSRFGINGADITAVLYHQQLGLGWIRFENLKWAFISPEKDKYAFDGSVAPWHVNQDEFIKTYTDAGLSYLPYVFQTPKWATSAPEGHKNALGFPPKNFNDYGTCIFQIVARYGSVKHPPTALLTNDKISGMGLLKVIELWNEPNLNAESWGPWVSTIERYFDIFRIGAEAAKKADPNIKVTSCGWAGIRTSIISRMQTYKYPDGKTPLDFTDILNVHYYSGKSDPETAYVDPNVQRGKKEAGPEDNDYETELRYLNEWWKDLKPNSPIWMTETGYDVGGPIGRDERYQAAKLPRCLMIALASGIQKVFVYREIGSRPAQHAGAGLIREDRSYRPSFFTYATLIREIDGTKEN